MDILIDGKVYQAEPDGNGKVKVTFTKQNNSEIEVRPLANCQGTTLLDNIQIEQNSKPTAYEEPSLIMGESTGLIKDVRDVQYALNEPRNGVYSKITQLTNSISLKVSNRDLLSQINIQANGILIQSGTNKLNVTPETTYIENGTIKSAMIKSLEVDKITGTQAQFTTMITKGLTADVITSTMIKADEALFDKLFSNSMATTKLAAQTAWITNANIVSLDAGKIKTGTIDSARINATQIVTNGLSANVVKSTHIESSTALVDKIFASDAYIQQLTGKTAFINSIKAIDINASKITGTNTSFVQSSWNAINSRLSVTGSELKYTHSDGSYTRLNANGIETVVAGGSYRHNYLMHIENVTINSGSGDVKWVQLPSVFKGKKFEYFMGVTDIYGALGDSAYNENKMVLKRFVLIKSPKYDVDYANARIPIVGYAHFVNTENRSDWFRALQGIVVAQY